MLQMHCKGICIHHKINKSGQRETGRYESGLKRCSFCEVFIEWEGLRCPCCGCILRRKPRNAKAREKIVESLKVKNIIAQK